MGVTPVSGRRAGGERLRASLRPRAATPGETAWIAAVPCALLTVLGMVLLGPPIGHAFLTPDPNDFFAGSAIVPHPEEHGRFLVALLGPPALAAFVLTQASPRMRARLRLPERTIRALVRTAQVGWLAVVALCFAAQQDVVLNADFPTWPRYFYFRWPTLLVALLLPAAALVLLRGRQLTAIVRAHAREAPRRRLFCAALAALYTAVWMTTALNLDSSLGHTTPAVTGHILWTMVEPFAVLDGRTPLVDYHAQYGQLWAYLAAAPMALFGATIGTYTMVMAIGTGSAAFAAYAIFRRLTRNSAAALALYAPFVATAFFTIIGPPGNRYGPQNLYLLWPTRYAGPMLLAWLAARHVDGARPRRAWAIFCFAGFVAVNNPDWGLAAGLATFAALAVVSARSWRTVRRLALEAAAGVGGAVAVVSLFTLMRSGSLPRFGLLFEFSRLYGIDGWGGQFPMPVLGLHVAVFLTFVAALVVAAVRAARAAQRVLLTGMLAWIGVFGLGASAYYVGRAHPLALFDFFAPWGFAIVLLALVVLPALDARAWRWATLPELAVLFALGLMVCSLPQTPAPWTQIARIRDRTPLPVFKQLSAVRLVRDTTHRGEKVGIVIPLSFRVAYDAGVVNVSPYSSIESMPTREMVARFVQTMHREGLHKVYMSLLSTRSDVAEALQAAGFVIQRLDSTRHYALLSDGG